MPPASAAALRLHRHVDGVPCGRQQPKVGRGGAVTQDGTRAAGENCSNEDALGAQPVVAPGVDATVHRQEAAGGDAPRHHRAIHPAVEELLRGDHPPLPQRNGRRQSIREAP